MAETKKAVTVNTAVKTETAAKPEVKEVKPVAVLAAAPEKKEEVKAEVKTEVKAPAKKKAAKAPAKKAPAKKAAAKTTAAKEGTAVKKAAVKTIINFQFSGKSYSMEDLEKIADDVWKYDLHKNNETYKSLELYVKPEESIAYYVFNGDVTGSFFI